MPDSAGSSLCTPLPDSALILSTGASPTKARRRPSSLVDLLPPAGVEQLPLVQQHDDRAAGRVDPLGEALVLVGHALGRVDDQQARRRRCRRTAGRGPASSTRARRRSGTAAACPRCRRSGSVPASVSTTVSTESRVVPGRSWTTDRSSPISRLKRVDLPTLGRPTIATATPAVVVGSGGPAPAVVVAPARAAGRPARRACRRCRGRAGR